MTRMGALAIAGALLLLAGCPGDPAPRADGSAMRARAAPSGPALDAPAPGRAPATPDAARGTSEVAGAGQAYDPVPANPGRLRVVLAPGIKQGTKVVEEKPLSAMPGEERPIPEPPPVEAPAEPPPQPKLIEVPPPR